MSESEINKKADKIVPDKNEFKNLMEEFDSGKKELSEGEKVEATILSREDDLFYLELGGRFEGEVPCSEFIDPESLINGDKIDVYILGKKGVFYKCSSSPGRSVNNNSGEYGTELETSFMNGDRVSGKITGTNKGGFEVMVQGLRGFCPFSQIEPEKNDDPERFVNKVLDFMIIEYDPESDKLVLGRRDILKEEKDLSRMKLLGSLNAGSIYKGIVSSVKNYGAFIDIGGIEGLLHVSEISNEKVEDATSIYSEGDEVEVMIKNIDHEKQKISLSIKELLADPWDDFMKNFSKGDIIEGTVSSLKPYGAFIDLLPGIRGLLHVSKLGDEKFHRHSKEVFRTGEKVKVWIDRIDEADKKIALTRVEPGIDLTRQLAKLKNESDREEKASSGSAFGQLLDSALSQKK